MKYIILRIRSSLKLLFLAWMTILGQFVYFSNHYSYEVASPLKLIKKP